MPNERFWERNKIAAVLGGSSLTANTYQSAAIPMAGVERVTFLVTTGAAVGGTVDLSIMGDTAAGGSFETEVTGKKLTQLAAGAGSQNKQYMIEVSGIEARVQNFSHLKAKLVVGTGGGDVTVVAISDGHRVAPVTQPASVLQKVG